MLYKGKIGQYSWLLHRVSGIGILIFLLIHVVDIFLIGFGPDVFNSVVKLYSHNLVRISEIFLFLAVLYHALNGLKIVICDFCPSLLTYHDKIFKWMMLIYVIVSIIVVSIMINHMVTY